MLTKEDFRPARADRLLFELAPFVSVFFALVAFASIPFGDTLPVGGRVIQLQAVTLNVGILYVFAMLSLGVYGVMMAGWSSANNYALLGGQRAAALMISAEIAIGASIMGVVMVYGSLEPAGHRARAGQSCSGLAAGLGHHHPAAGLRPLPHRRHRRHQAHPVRHAGRRVGDHRLLRRVQRHEVRHVPHDRLGGDDGDRGPLHRRCSWAAGRCRISTSDGFHFPWGAVARRAAPAGDAAAGRAPSSPRSP